MKINADIKTDAKIKRLLGLNIKSVFVHKVTSDWSHFLYSVIITKGNKSIVFEHKKGLGHVIKRNASEFPIPPSLSEVCYSFMMYYIEKAERQSPDEWIENFESLDNLSANEYKKYLRTFNACVAQSEKIDSLSMDENWHGVLSEILEDY